MRSEIPPARDIERWLMTEKLSIPGAHLPAFAVSAGAPGHGGIPLRYETAPTFPKILNS